MALFSRSLSRKQFFVLGAIIILAMGTLLTAQFIQQQQIIEQHAAAQADLVVTGFQLTDAAGNVKTTFVLGEDIYVRVTVDNKGGAKGVSTDGFTFTQFYSNLSTAATVNQLSDVGVTMRNGEFGVGTNKTYGSSLLNENSSFFNTSKERFWSKATKKQYTARVFVNFDRHVAESNYDNNQATVTYTIADLVEKGTVSFSRPSNRSSWPTCDKKERHFVSGVSSCVGQGIGPGGKAVSEITNNTSNTITVGLGAYKAYLPYAQPNPFCESWECPDKYNWIWTQTFFAGITTPLQPGQTVYLTTDLPSCSWQIDAFKGKLLPSFHRLRTTYSGENRYLDGWYETRTPCVPVIPSPTPTSTPSITPSVQPSITPTKTPTPTINPSVTPTNTPTTTVTPSPTQTPTPTITPTPPACPIPTKVLNVRISCPNCSSQ